MKFFIIILTIIFLAGCSPARRMQRLLNCHPELIKTDTVLQTITVRDTVKIPGTEIDTFFMSMDTDSSRGGKAEGTGRKERQPFGQDIQNRKQV